MIRLPPTCIGLSENDIRIHFQEFAIKQNLYAQGFGKDEVQRLCMGHYNWSNSIDTVPTAQPLKTSVLDSEDELTNATNNLSLQGKDKERLGLDGGSCNDGTSLRRPPLLQPDHCSPSPRSPPSSPPLPQLAIPYRHAPVRQSSLLRNTYNASSLTPTKSSSSLEDDLTYSEDQDWHGNIMVTGSFWRPSPARSISHRAWNKTYKSIKSEANRPTSTSGSNGIIENGLLHGQNTDNAEDFQAVKPDASSPGEIGALNPKAVPFLPTNLITSPPLASPSIPQSLRMPSPQSPQPQRPCPLDPCAIDWQGSSSPSLPSPPSIVPSVQRRHEMTAVEQIPVRPTLQLSFGSDHHVVGQRRTSSTRAATTQDPSTSSSIDSPTADSSSSPLEASPVQSLPVRPDSARTLRPPFGIYNDNYPAEVQPQTPADLQSGRKRVFTERSIAYTAPPGQIRGTVGISGSRAVPLSGTRGAYDARTQNDHEIMLQSPTERTARMRQTRAREWERRRQRQWRRLWWFERHQHTRNDRSEEEEEENDDSGGDQSDTERGSPAMRATMDDSTTDAVAAVDPSVGGLSVRGDPHVIYRRSPARGNITGQRANDHVAGTRQLQQRREIEVQPQEHHEEAVDGRDVATQPVTQEEPRRLDRTRRRREHRNGPGNESGDGRRGTRIGREGGAGGEDDGTEPGRFIDWRQFFDEDRVGEENFGE